MHVARKTDGPDEWVHYACNICQADYDNLADLKAHYRTQWHLYNLKRNMADLEPVTSEAYDKKVEKASMLTPSTKGVAHRKPRKSPVKRDRPSSTVPFKTSYNSASQSLFDNQVSSSVEENLKYMRHKYSFTILDLPYVTDISKLLMFLGRLIHEDHVCLECCRGFRNLQAVRHHMLSLGHTSIGAAVEAELHELFYDYSQSYAELNLPQEVKKPVAELLPAEDVPDIEESEADWEDITELDPPPALEHVLQRHGLQRARINAMGNLICPNGKELPHRAIAHVYKQRLPLRRGTPDTPVEKNKPLKSFLRIKRLRCQREQYNRLRVGVRANKLQRTFLKSTKYFI